MASTSSLTDAALAPTLDLDFHRVLILIRRGHDSRGIRKLAESIEAALPFLGGVGELEDHGELSLVGRGILGAKVR
jgi:hypothetical protein